MQETEPEELPMDVVLDEIRQMLLADTENDQKSEPLQENEDVEVCEIPQKQIPEEPDYFLLTPEMRCDLDEQKLELSEIIQKRTQQVVNKLNHQQNSDEIISPVLEKWLNENLPTLVEKAVAEKLSK